MKRRTLILLLACLLSAGCSVRPESDPGSAETVTAAEESEAAAEEPEEAEETVLTETAASADETTAEEEVMEKKTPALSNPEADEKTKAVYRYLCESFGEVMLSCQMESTWMGSPDYEMNYIEKTTGKLPAMRGLDFMNNDFKGVVKRAKEWDGRGGLVTICWHTGVYGSGYDESKADDPDFGKLFTEGTEEYEGMMKSWDACAGALAELRHAGVPVLWRPFHEFDGQWFWWGKGGADDFIRLWRLMYDKFTNEYHLTNLIWVLGYSGDVKDGWYPGDEYCDIVGSDTYDNSTHKQGFRKLEKITDKPLCFHECGNIPAVEKFEEQDDLWLYFMIWHTDHIMNNDPENLTAVYNHEKVVTLDELPGFGG